MTDHRIVFRCIGGDGAIAAADRVTIRLPIIPCRVTMTDRPPARIRSTNKA
jgi:hypothetical protein